MFFTPLYVFWSKIKNSNVYVMTRVTLVNRVTGVNRTNRLTNMMMLIRVIQENQGDEGDKCDQGDQGDQGDGYDPGEQGNHASDSQGGRTSKARDFKMISQNSTQSTITAGPTGSVENDNIAGDRIGTTRALQVPKNKEEMLVYLRHFAKEGRPFQGQDGKDWEFNKKGLQVS